MGGFAQVMDEEETAVEVLSETVKVLHEGAAGLEVGRAIAGDGGEGIDNDQIRDSGSDEGGEGLAVLGKGKVNRGAVSGLEEVDVGERGTPG